MKKTIISIFFLVTILFQSCVVYQKSSVSLDESLNKGKTKIIDKHEIRNGLKVISPPPKEHTFKNIELINGVYYGVSAKDTIAIDTTVVASVYLRDIKKSNISTIILVAALVPVVVLIGAAISLRNADFSF